MERVSVSELTGRFIGLQAEERRQRVNTGWSGSTEPIHPGLFFKASSPTKKKLTGNGPVIHFLTLLISSFPRIPG